MKASAVEHEPYAVALLLKMSDVEALELIHAIRSNASPMIVPSKTAVHIRDAICPAIQKALSRPAA